MKSKLVCNKETYIQFLEVAYGLELDGKYVAIDSAIPHRIKISLIGTWRFEKQNPITKDWRVIDYGTLYDIKLATNKVMRLLETLNTTVR